MKNGIDVSALQGRINWSTAGVDFAMVKATQGRGETKATLGLRVFTDRRFRENVENASAAGIALGCYHYLTARTKDEALFEAEYFCRTIEPYRDRLKLWAAADVESPRWLVDLDREKITAVTETFLEQLSSSGWRPMLYTNPDFLKNRFTRGFDADIWLAHWNVEKPMEVPRLKIWQYGGGNMPGVGVCGLDIGYFGGYSVGDSYTIKRGDVYSNGLKVPERLIGRSCTIAQIREGRVLLGEINSWVKI